MRLQERARLLWSRFRESDGSNRAVLFERTSLVDETPITFDRCYRCSVPHNRTIHSRSDTMEVQRSTTAATANGQTWAPQRDVSTSVSLIRIGRGAIVEVTRAATIRYTDAQVDHFIEYILSPHITTDLPFGEKKISLSTGEIITVPNNIRNLIPARIIRQYHLFCTETCANIFKPLSTSVLYEILDGCSASTRKSLQGLDYFSAEGSTAFDNLMKIADELLLTGEKVLYSVQDGTGEIDDLGTGK